MSSGEVSLNKTREQHKEAERKNGEEVNLENKNNSDGAQKAKPPDQ